MELVFKLDGEQFEVGKLTLGEAFDIQRHFGVRSFMEFDWTNPGYLAALVYIALRRKAPNDSHEALMSRVEQVDVEELLASVAESVKEPDPPTDAGGSSGTTRGRSGGKTRASSRASG